MVIKILKDVVDIESMFSCPGASISVHIQHNGLASTKLFREPFPTNINEIYEYFDLGGDE